MKIIFLLLLSISCCFAQKRYDYELRSGNRIYTGTQPNQSGWRVVNLTPFTSASSNPTNLIIDFEGGVNGNVIGTNLIHSFTTGVTNLSTAGAFQVQSNGLTVTGAVTMVISTAQAARGTRSLRMDLAVDNVQILATLKSSNVVMSYGMAIYLDSGWSGATFSSYNFADLHTQNGIDFATINLFDGSSPNLEWATQTGNGLSGPIVVTAATFVNHWYWVTVKWDGTAGLSSIRMFNYVGSGVLGTEIDSVKQGTFLGTPRFPNAMLFGRPDNHDVFNPGAFWYIDDVVLRWDGTYPVLPP